MVYLAWGTKVRPIETDFRASIVLAGVMNVACDCHSVLFLTALRTHGAWWPQHVASLMARTAILTPAVITRSFTIPVAVLMLQISRGGITDPFDISTHVCR